MIHLSTDIIDRITAQVPELATVGGPYLLADLASDEFGSKLDMAIVSSGAGNHIPVNTISGGRLESQDWDVTLAVKYRDSDGGYAQTEAHLAALLSKIYAAVHGFNPGIAKARRHFQYKSRSAPNYQQGYALCVLTFSIDAII